MSRRRFIPSLGQLTRRAAAWLRSARTTRPVAVGRYRGTSDTSPAVHVQHHPNGTTTKHTVFYADHVVIGSDRYSRVIGPGIVHTDGPNREDRRRTHRGRARRSSLAAANRIDAQPLRRREAEAVAHKRRLARFGVTGQRADILTAAHIRNYP